MRKPRGPNRGWALWVRPSTLLRGRIGGSCSGVSIVLPVDLLALDASDAYHPDPDGGPMLLDPFSRRRPAGTRPLLQSAWDLLHTIDGLGPVAVQRLLDSLIQHLRAWPRAEPWTVAPIGRAEHDCRTAEHWMHQHPDQPISLRDVPTALAISPRTLQISVRSQREVSSIEALQRLRRRHRQRPETPTRH